MAKMVTMPKLGNTVESSLLTKWHKSIGDHIEVGEVLFSCETDKASFDQESEFEGTIRALLYKAGDIVPVLVDICVIGEPNEDISSILKNKNVEKTIEDKAEVKQVVSKLENSTVGKTEQRKPLDESVVMTPRAQQLADKLGVHIEDCIPTGPKNRVVEMDIRRASVEPRNSKDTNSVLKTVQTLTYQDEKLSNIRKIIAKNMLYSLATTAQLTHTASFDCTKILALRESVKTLSKQGLVSNITLNDMIIYAVSRVLKSHKALNAHLIDNDTMRYFNEVNIGIATDTSRGLMVPTLFNADSLTLDEIAKQSSSLIKAAQAGNIDPSLLSGATFTISNLGSLGIEHFTPVINPPQTGILGVNTITTKIKLDQDENIVPYQSMGLSLTYDHRAVDGAPASRFLKDLREFLENF